MAPIQTFKQLQDKTLAWLDEAGDTGTTQTLVKFALQKSHTKRLAQERWPFMLYPPQTLNCVPNQLLYPLHSEYLRPMYFRNLTVLDYMTQYDEATLVSSGADWNNDSGDALRFVLHTRSEVANQPLVASVVTVTSSVPATDNGAASVLITGDTATGVRSETITANSSGVIPFTFILKVTKSNVWAGTMTLAGGATTLLTLFASEYGRSYQQIKLLANPSGPQLVEYQFYRQPSTLVEDNDRPDIPTPFEDLLVYDTLLSFAAYNQYDVATVALWKAERDELLLALQQTYSDAKALESATTYTAYVPR